MQSTDTLSVYRSYQGGFFKTLISPEDNNSAFALLDMVLPKGSEPPPHFHTNEDESFYLLEGSVSFKIGDKVTVANTGDAVFAPRMVPHHFNILTDQARFINLITPGNLWNYFIDFSMPSNEEPVVAPLQGPPPPEAIELMLTQLQQVYGINFIGLQ